MNYFVFVRIAWFIYSLRTIAGSTSEVYFVGKSFLRYVPSKSIFEKDNVNIIELHFRTIHPTGLIVLMVGQYDDSLALRLIQGKLSYRVTRASPTKPEFAEILAGNNLNDDEWHHVKVLRTGRLNEVILDNEPKTLLSPASFRMLTFSQVFFIGGYENKYLRMISHLKAAVRFHGCIRIIQIDNRDPVLYLKKHSSRVHIIPDGNIMLGCPVPKSNPIEFTKPASSVEVQLESNRTDSVLSFSMSLRTLSKNGNILLATGKKSSLQLYIKNSKLALDLIQNAKNSIVSRVLSDIFVSNGQWHVITMIVSDTDLFLEVNGRARSSQSIAQASLSCTSPEKASIGGTSSYEGNGFVGCLNKLSHNNNELRLLNSKDNIIFKNGVNEGCNLRDLCYPSPCRNGGRCVQNWKTYTCDCSSTNFYGNQCEKSIYRSNCAGYQTMGLTETSYCLIDSDGAGDIKPFTSLCQFDDQNRAYTIISHSKKTEFSAVKGDLKFQKYVFHTIKYDLELAKILSLIKKSKFCRQKLTFRCRNALLLNAPNGPSNVGWRNARNELKTYWGGATKNGEGCACGLNKSCIKPDKLCNCDSLNDRWAIDTGYITNKWDLPIIRLDVAEFEKGEGNITVGPLECFGESGQDDSRTTDNQDETNIFPKDILARVCMSIQAKNNLVNIANSSKRKILEAESEPVLTTMRPFSDGTSSRSLTFSPYPVTHDGASESLSILEITLISVAAVAVLILIVKFFVCTICQRLNGQVLLNHQPGEHFDSDLKHNGESSGKMLYQNGDGKPKRKGLLNAYWV